MDSLKILERVNDFRMQKGISVYRLTKEACVSHNTINAWRKRQTMPSFGVLEALCDAMSVPIAALFLEEYSNINELSAETNKMLSLWEGLNYSQKIVIINLILELQK